MTDTGGPCAAAGRKIDTLAIGAAGELLVQYKLLKLGINSAWGTTDSGIDGEGSQRPAVADRRRPRIYPETGADQITWSTIDEKWRHVVTTVMDLDTAREACENLATQISRVDQLNAAQPNGDTDHDNA
jgi:hypothetical protein